MAGDRTRRLGRWLALAAIMILVGGCAWSRPVYIPADWRTAPQPQPAATGTVAGTQRPAPGEPILEPPGDFTESTIEEAPLPDDMTETATDTGPGPYQQPGTDTAPQPQTVASMHLVGQARVALNNARPEEAIDLLEQAIKVDVYNGEAFFALAESWRMKADGAKALEFAKKAEILFQDKPKRLKQVYLFEADLLEGVGDYSGASGFKEKADRL